MGPSDAGLERAEKANITSRLIAGAKWLFWATVLAFCIVWLPPRWRELGLSERLVGVDLSWAALALVVLGLQYVLAFYLWVTLLRLCGAKPLSSVAYRAYALSLVSRYLPGKVVGQGVRVLIIQTSPLVSTGAAVGSVVWETALVIGSASIVSGLILVGSADFATPDLPTVALIIVISILVLSYVLASIFRRSSSSFIKSAATPAGAHGRILMLLGFYVITWPIHALAHWCLANSFQSLAFSSVIPLTGALALAWLAGVVAVIAPAGVGVREGVLYAFIVPWLGAADSLLFVTLSRVLIIVVESMVASCWLIASFWRRWRPVGD